jgi:hypothetical protein
MMLGTIAARAVPYASCVTNNSGTISYYLNEGATDVKIIFNGGASTNDLGTQTKGLRSFGRDYSGSAQAQPCWPDLLGI